MSKPALALAFTTALLVGAAPSALADEAAEPLPIAGYDGGFFIQTEDGESRLKANGRVQLRHTLEVPGEGETGSQFSIPRARLAFSGSVLTQRLTYKLQLDFGKGGASLKDALAEYKIIPKALHIGVGQTKRPFSRQQLTSSSKLILVDRAITDKAFGSGRDIGVWLHNGFSKSPTFEWAVGLYNGTGDKGELEGDVVVAPTPNDDGQLEGEITGGKFNNVPWTFEPAVVARFGYNLGNLKGYSEGDFEGGGFRLGLGTSLFLSFDADGGDDGHLRWELDGIMKVAGFALDGAFYLRTAQGQGWDDQDVSLLGLHLQASYVIDEHWVPVVRYERTMAEVGDDYQQVALAGVGLYLFGHKAKLVVDGAYSDTREGGANEREFVLRTQVQLQF